MTGSSVAWGAPEDAHCLRNCFRGMGGSHRGQGALEPPLQGEDPEQCPGPHHTTLWREKLEPRPLTPTALGGWGQASRPQSGQIHTGLLGGIQRARLFTKRFTNITLCLPTAPCEVGQSSYLQFTDGETEARNGGVACPIGRRPSHPPIKK